VLVAGLYGLAIGSFLNVVIWRLPRGQSVNTPTWSYCPNCEHRLGTLDLFPVVSFLALGAKCRYCKQPISWRYPGVELLTGVLFALVAWYEFQAGGQWYDAVFFCLFAAILLCVFFIDLEHFIIPDSLSVLMVVLGLVHAAIAGTFLNSVLGLFGYAAVIYLIGLLSYVYLVSVLDKRLPAGTAAWSYLTENADDWAYVSVYYLGTLVPPLRRSAEKRWGAEPPLEGFTSEEIEADEDAGGMGGGDGKLAAGIGANLGLALALGSLGFAIFIGAFAGLIVIARQRRRLGERVPIPFGPAMALGALLALFYGHALASWYVGTFWTLTPAPAAPSSAAVPAPLTQPKNKM
jgi:leader peptidase (prepilin peptidase)/N-methyltransferase